MTERVERSLHLGSSVGIALTERDRDAGSEDGARLVETVEPGQKLAALEIARNVVGMGLAQAAEVLKGGFVILFAGAFHSQAVTRECVVGTGCDKGFQFLASRIGVGAHRSAVLYGIPRRGWPSRNATSRR